MSAQKKQWPRFALSPKGERAKFDCMADVMPGWKIETPLPPEQKETLDGDPDWAAPVKRGPGRPPKVKADDNG